MNGRSLARIQEFIDARLTTCLLGVVCVLAMSACSHGRIESNGNSSAAPNEPSSSANANKAASGSPVVLQPDFDVTAAWRPKSIVVNTKRSSALDPIPGMKYTVTTKPGSQFVALELTLKKERRGEPVSAKVVLIDSSGGRHDAIFSFASAATKYRPNGDSISFDNDSGDSGQPLSTRGGKLITVFEVPPDKTGYKVEIDGSSPMDVALNPR